MRKLALAGLLPAALLSMVLAAHGHDDAPERLDGALMKEMVEGLGYEMKTLNDEVGKEKYEFTMTRGGLDISVAVELSVSKGYLWLTVHLGEIAEDALKAKAPLLLRENAKIQPSGFSVTDAGRLMVSLAMDNRHIGSAELRRAADKLVDDVVSTKALWQ
jgi:hypothetical protein